MSDLASMQSLDATAGTTDDDDLVEEELLVEEVSIDGMCGVY
jgi:mycofactocin precursor